MRHDILIIGGGLAGLTAALDLSKRGLSVGLIEKKAYPFHRVCGEYVSNEVLPYLHSLDIHPKAWGATSIHTFKLTSPKGRIVSLQLPLGGFGISRYTFDHHLYQAGIQAGVNFYLEETVQEVTWENGQHTVKCTSGSTFTAPVVLAAYGKRSALDRKLKRPFFSQRSPYVGVKFHAELDIPSDEVSLHNFQAGYCGVSQIENGLVNICYLARREQVRAHGNLEGLQQHSLSKNPFLAEVLQHARPVWEKPLAINEISFAPKAPIEQHMLMIGDAAGLITPLCGNGMAMAILGAKRASELAYRFSAGMISRIEMEKSYRKEWQKEFGARLWVGRKIQAMFQHTQLSELSVGAMDLIPGVAKGVIRLTHG